MVMATKKKKIYDVNPKSKRKVYNADDILDLDDDETGDNKTITKKKHDKLEITNNDLVLNIKELDINTITPTSIDDPDGSKYVIIGKPGTGKSFLAQDIIYNKRHIFPVGQFYSGTEDSNKTFSQIVPQLFIDNEIKDYKDSWSNFKKRQNIMMDLNKLHKDIVPWSIRVEDDLSTDPKIFNKETYLDVFKNSRHWKSMYLLLLQYAMDIKPAIRTCIDGTFLLREATVKGREKLFNNFVPCVESLPVFNVIMDVITENYTSLFINNKVQSNSADDCLFYYKAKKENVENFKKCKFGCIEYHQYSDDRCKKKD